MFRGFHRGVRRVTSQGKTHGDMRRADEFMGLYVPCQRRLYTYIVMLVGNPMVAHDILQDTNLVLWQKFEQFQPGTNFFAWAREVARFRVLRYRQLQAPDILLVDPALLSSFEERTTDEDSDRPYAEALAGCIGKLKEADADLLRRRYSGDFSVTLLARQLSRSQNAVSQALARIRRALRFCIERTMAAQG
jgi:RNA polymerase sigma-70 factor, ECF subfamily